ncbi:MAG: SDR family oxidoreductase [Solirubrobacterales bacterium]|nr:SDR family oxidoreductase [Solirubrobacterales bacterium]
MTAEQSARTGEVVIVTGGAKGIGLSYVEALAEAGYAVVVADRSDPEPTAQALASAGASALGMRVDVSDQEATEALAERVLDRYGRIDVLVNNAGYFSSIVKKGFDELTIEEWELAYRVNVIGSWLCTKAVVPAMKRQGGGKIINTSSMTVPSGVPGFLHYVTSKSAVVGYTRALARELGEWGITVNTISPDYIPHDPDYAGRQPEMAAAIAGQRCLKRDQTTADMVGTLLHLAGHGSDFVTGQDLWVNGGRLFH